MPDSISKGNGAGGASINDEQLVHKHKGPEILSTDNTGSNQPFITHQAQNRLSFDLLHGELEKLSTLVSQLAVALGVQTTAVPVVTGSSPAAVSAQFRSPTTTGSGAAASSAVNSRNSPCGSSTTPYVAPQVFGEMPQTCGFQNLNRQSILLADGTIHSYYVLPDTYPLDQATPAQIGRAHV